MLPILSSVIASRGCLHAPEARLYNVGNRLVFPHRSARPEGEESKHTTPNRPRSSRRPRFKCVTLDQNNKRVESEIAGPFLFITKVRDTGGEKPVVVVHLAFLHVLGQVRPHGGNPADSCPQRLS